MVGVSFLCGVSAMTINHHLLTGITGTNGITGMKTIPLDGAGWEESIGGGASEQLSPLRAYHLVPYLYRAVDIRAKTLASIPYTLSERGSGNDVSNTPTYGGLVRGLHSRLLLTESSLCLYGAAYWLKEVNRIGRNISPRWVVPTSIVPRFDARAGLVGFERNTGRGTHRLTVDQVVSFWAPNLTTETGPGVAPVQVALGAARVLHSLDQFADGFFRRGAIKATLLTVEGNPPKAELERLESWWRRLVAGVRNAWQSVAIRSTVKPVTIGDGLADVQNRELTTQQRESVCAALGVPHSLLSASAANYATSINDKITFLNQTVLPEAALIEETLNEQLFGPLGLVFAFEPDRLEEFQQHEVEKTKSLVPLVEAGIMTKAEARKWLGLEETDEQHEPCG